MKQLSEHPAHMARSKPLPRRSNSKSKRSAARDASGPNRRGQTYKPGRITREAIVRAAESVLVEHGHANFTLQRVATKIGISPGNLNYHFPTRAALLETLIVYTLAQYRHRVRTAGDAMNTGSREALANVLLWLMEDARSEHTCRLFRELWAMALHDPRVAKAMDSFYARSVAAHVRRLEEGSGSQATGQDIEAIIFLMHVLSEGTTVIFGTLPNAQPLFERVRRLAHQALVQLLARA
jgi:AcrR family transcriptional regulator